LLLFFEPVVAITWQKTKGQCTTVWRTVWNCMCFTCFFLCTCKPVCIFSTLLPL